MNKTFWWIAAMLLVGGASGGRGTVWAQQPIVPPDGKGLQQSATLTKTQAPAVTGAQVACDDGKAELYSCSNVNLLAYLPSTMIGGERDCTSLLDGCVNDIWGWTDPQTGKEYAIIGLWEGASFIDVTDPVNPVYLGILPSHTQGSLWHDVKVYADHAYVVSDVAGAHGMQVFDLTQLRDVVDPPMTFTETVHYDAFGSSHNVAVNEDTGFAYVVGANSGGETCGGGLHMIDIREPKTPTFAGCFADVGTGRSGTGYTHDAQCVTYRGPDADYQGQEICFGANETHLSIAAVTDKANPVALSRASYPNVRYAHQGWLTEDQRYFFQNDEMDESGNTNTRTIIWDLSDLDDPVVAEEFFNTTTSTDHNLYVRGNYVYQANYTSGLRILDISNPVHPVEVAFFDTTPTNDNAGYHGTWSVYPYFESGTVIVSSMEEGLFILKPNDLLVDTAPDPEVPSDFALTAAYPNPFNPTTTLTLALDRVQAVTLAVYDALGREVARLHDGPLEAGSTTFTFDAPADLPSGTYIVRATGERATETRAITLLK